jgi:hypothetical protein
LLESVDLRILRINSKYFGCAPVKCGLDTAVSVARRARANRWTGLAASWRSSTKAGPLERPVRNQIPRPAG